MNVRLMPAGLWSEVDVRGTDPGTVGVPLAKGACGTVQGECRVRGVEGVHAFVRGVEILGEPEGGCVDDRPQRADDVGEFGQLQS